MFKFKFKKKKCKKLEPKVDREIMAEVWLYHEMYAQEEFIHSFFFYPRLKISNID